MKLSRKIPKCQQIVSTIIQEIKNGKLAPGERLATVRELACNFQTSSFSTLKALQKLVNEKFVECRGASGFYVIGKQEAETLPTDFTVPSNGQARVFFSLVNHSDLVWLRTYEDYAGIRDKQLSRQLFFSEKYRHMVFAVEQAEILRVYLAAHPEKKETFRTLLENGQMEAYGGMTIPDLNMTSGESILRNLLAGQDFYRKEFGYTPTVCSMDDTFGFCSQLPQILSIAGYRYVVGTRTPNLPSELGSTFCWEGAAGRSVLFCNLKMMGHGGYVYNVKVTYDSVMQLCRSLIAFKSSAIPLQKNVLLQYCLEEGTFLEEIFALVNATNREGGRPIEFAGPSTYFQVAEKQDLPHYRGEINPVFTGCYTSRIEVKQAIRKAEHQLFKAEFLDSISEKKGQNLDSLWHELFLVQFHDAICGCHSDAANADIRKKLDAIFQRLQLNSGDSLSFCNFNNVSGRQMICSEKIPAGVPAQRDGEDFYFEAEFPPCGVCSFRKKRTVAVPEGVSCKPRFKTDFYEVDFSSNFPGIRDRAGLGTIGRDGFGEILFRRDSGSMWVESYLSPYLGRASEEENVTECLEGELFYKIVVEGKVRANASTDYDHNWREFGSLFWKKEFFFPKHQNLFRLRLTLDWRGIDTKISIRFPVDIDPSTALLNCEVPFGTCARRPYFEISQKDASYGKELLHEEDYSKAYGDWPVLNVVTVADSSRALSIANNGTPGHQFANSAILISLLRSPTATADGGYKPEPGAMDNGKHVYEFAFRPHLAYHQEEGLELGDLLNRMPEQIAEIPFTGSLISWKEKNIRLSSIRRVPDGLIVRLFEAIGISTSFFPCGELAGKRWFACAADGTGHQGCKFPVEFQSFEIRTFFVKDHE